MNSCILQPSVYLYKTILSGNLRFLIVFLSIELYTKTGKQATFHIAIVEDALRDNLKQQLRRRTAFSH